MLKPLLPLLCTGLLAGCTDGRLTRHDQDANRGYFADALECGQSAMRKETVNVPTAGSVSVVEIPTVYDADKFVVCMAHAGRPVSRADLAEYLYVSNACLHEARYMENPDDGYAACVTRSRLNVEIIDDK